MAICLGEIERCQKASPRPNFVILLGNRYGWRPLPYAIPSDEFDQLYAFVLPADQGALLTWYRRDDNAIPPVHILQPRTGEYEAYEAWEPVESQLRAVLERSALQAHLSAASLVKYMASATEQEIVAGALQVPDATRAHLLLRDLFSISRRYNAWPPRDRPRCRPAKAGGSGGTCASCRVAQYQTPWQGDQPALEHLDQLCEDVYAELSRGHPDRDRPA